jgi:hypothetical protein
MAYAVTTDRFARGKTGRTWGVFTTGCVLFFSLNVLGNYYIHFRVAGEPGRLVPELDLVYILGASALLLWLWEQTGRAARVAVAAVIAAAFATTAGYVRHAWHIYALWPDYQSRVEYRITDWLAKNMPEVRAYPTGSVRFWFDAWHDLAHLGGSSDQGLLNGQVEPAQWETILGSNAEPSVLWLQAMGVDAAYVADKRSQEIFKDYRFPKKFEGVLPVIYHNHEGDTIYRVPRRYASRARVVDTQKLNGLKPPRFNDDVEYLRAYVDAIEKGPESPVALERRGTDAMELRPQLTPGQSIVGQESYGPAWQAWSGGQPLPVRKDAMGFIVIGAPPGDQQITLEFVTPLENRVGRVVTVITILAVCGLIAIDWRRQRSA